jgi:hypothetical protein
MFTSHNGMVSSPKAIDFPKHRVRHELGMVSTLTLFFLEGFSMVSTKLFFKKT